ncbi:MAG TPA: amidophosphoribosyltransferase, partial [Thermodesulfobacteriota bacterium]|nr:amidophosphoribosyltransferase [Thermodesulfobacteriota bacterium]
MSGIFGIVSNNNCASTLFYGTDYHSHMGTEYGGMAVLGTRFNRAIHDISQSQFKSKFVDEYKTMQGPMGIGVISDRDPQPLIVGSRFGTFAIVNAGLIENLESLSTELLEQGHSFGEMTSGGINSVELVAKLINTGKDLVDGFDRMLDKIHGAATLLLLTRE